MNSVANDNQTVFIEQPKSRLPVIFGIIAILFGIVTLFSGGNVLFGSELARTAAGNYVEWVVWFNFLAGFAYVLAGVALLGRKSWAVWLSVIIAGATLLAAIGLGYHILSGGEAEPRTIGAMVMRFGVWAGISAKIWRMVEFR